MTRPIITRSIPLIDLEVGGDGRTVTAYAATFNDPYEVKDQHGHYIESINRTAFDRTISHGITRTAVLMNHGLTVWGTPSERYSDPIGVPLAIRAETKGLLTVTRYGNNDVAEQALTMIKDGTVTTYSFRGSIFRSAPARRHSSGLSLIERTELGLTDYGPAIIAVNDGAKILALRSAALAEEIAQMTDEERAALLAQFSTSPALEAPSPEQTDDPPADEAPDRSMQIIALLEVEAAQRRRRLGL